MFSALRARWQQIRDQLWFLPGVVTIGFAALALALVQLDRAAGTTEAGIVFGGSPSAAREILATIAGSIITVAGLAFSLTIITLQLVSQQFSPRATRTFLGNKPTQISAGVFVGIFVYCLIVLRAVREEDFGEFVPGFAVTVAIVLGVAGIAVLLFFINHTAQSIKVSSIASRIAHETLSSIDEIYPDPYGRPVDDGEAEEAVARWREEGKPVSVGPGRPGYVTRLDLESLVEHLPDGVERLQVHVAPGEFVTEEQPLVSVWPPGLCNPDRLERPVRRSIVVANEREVREDAAYGIQQLADVALRAISPSVNDPATAVTCVGYIAACLERLAGRAFPSARRRIGDSGVDVAARRQDFGLFVATGLDDVGRWASSSRRVVEALLSAAARAAAAATEAGAEEHVAALRAAAERVAEPALEETRLDADRAAIEEALADVARAAEGRERRAAGMAAGGHRPW